MTLAEDAEPADDEWLSRLLAPFREALPPSAVQGGLQVQFAAGGPPYDPFFTAETRRWRQRMGGLAFSLANAAIRRDVWERLPAVPSAGLADRHWQRELAANGELILPCWAAAVRWIRPLRSAAVVRDAWREGRAGAGSACATASAELVADLWRGTGPDGASAEAAASPARRADATPTGRYGLLRPPALLLGNRLPRRRRGPAIMPGGGPHPHETESFPRPGESG